MNPWIDGNTKPRKRRWFDLCRVELEDGTTMNCWWDGTEWQGLRYEGQKIKRWRHVHYDDN